MEGGGVWMYIIAMGDMIHEKISRGGTVYEGYRIHRLYVYEVQACRLLLHIIYIMHNTVYSIHYNT